MPILNDSELDLRLHDAGALPPRAGAECIDTPEFDLGRVLTLAGGGEDVAALDHVARCAFCRAMLRDAAVPASDLLVARLNREWPATATHAPPSRRLAFGVVGGFLAMAAAVTLLILRPATLTPAPEFSLDGPSGGLMEVRADVPESNVFVPDSQVRLVLHPKASPQKGTALGLFRVEVGEKLARLPAGLAQVQPNGAWLIEGEGRALFGESAGAKHLLIVVAGDAAALTDLEGRAASALDGRTDLRSYEIKVEYRLRP